MRLMYLGSYRVRQVDLRFPHRSRGSARARSQPGLSGGNDAGYPADRYGRSKLEDDAGDLRRRWSDRLAL